MKKIFIIANIIIIASLLTVDLYIYLNYLDNADKLKARGISDLEIRGASYVEEGSGSYTILAFIRNSNNEWGARKFDYEFSFSSGGLLPSKRSGFSFILPGQSRYIIENGIKTPGIPKSLSFKINNLKWARITGETDNPDIITRENNYKAGNIGEEGYGRSTGFVYNKSSYNIRKLDLDIILYDKKKSIIGAYRIFLDDLKAFNQKPFEKIWDWPTNGEVDYFDVFPNANILDPNNFSKG